MRVAGEARAAPAADHAQPVRVVRHQPGVMFVGERQQFGERRQIAVHGEHTVGDDQRVVVFGAMPLKQFARMGDVVVAKRHHRAARQLRAGEQAGVRQLIRQHQPVAADQHRDDAGIGEIAGAEHHGGLRLLDAGEPRLQLRIQRVVAGDQARGAGAGAIGLDRGLRRLLDGRVLGQVEIVVAGKRQQAAAVALDPDAVLAHSLGQRAAQMAALQIVELGLRELVERGMVALTITTG